MRARLFTPAILCAVAITLITTARAEAPAPLAAPKPQNQIGFPAELYSWVIPPDNPQTPAKVELGRKLFFDDRLSADGPCRAINAMRPPRASPISFRPRWVFITRSDSATPRLF
jgi:cytochrome c peroxidase